MIDALQEYENPRNLNDFSEERLDAQIAELRENKHALEEALETFNSPGWGRIVNVLGTWLSDARRSLESERTDTMEKVIAARAKASEITRLLDLKGIIQYEHENVTQRLKGLEASDEDSDDEQEE